MKTLTIDLALTLNTDGNLKLTSQLTNALTMHKNTTSPIKLTRSANTQLRLMRDNP